MEQKDILRHIYGQISRLQCSVPMVWYYQSVYASIKHLMGEIGFMDEESLARMSPERVREFRRYINADLENYGIEFYLQRVEWAHNCYETCKKESTPEARANPARHPCQMSRGFRRIVDGGLYSYKNFLGETLPIFVAIHVHLNSINRALGTLYYYVTELPAAAFTPSGKSEIQHLTRELNRIMRGLLVATHLQPQVDWQRDLVNYLISCRADCQRFFETIPRYYQTHRMRLVISVDSHSDTINELNNLPLACLPWSAGVYLDFLISCESIVRHVMAVMHWAIRLYSLWYPIPKRYTDLVAPILRV